MKPRYADERIGFFTVGTVDFGTSEQVAKRQASSSRGGASSARTGKRAISAIRSSRSSTTSIRTRRTSGSRGFARRSSTGSRRSRRPGFKNGIIPGEVPKNDPDWSPEDIRHTMVRWLPSTVENSVGPHVQDPRTGEIAQRLVDDLPQPHRADGVLVLHAGVAGRSRARGRFPSPTR